MILLDVNVLVYAHRAESIPHQAARQLVLSLVNGNTSFGIPEIVLQSVVRVITQIKDNPSTLQQALDFCNTVRSSPVCVIVQPSERHWVIFEQLCRALNARGKLISDTYLAAFAIDHDAEWVTADRDFAKFPGLRWRNLLTGQVRTNPR